MLAALLVVIGLRVSEVPLGACVRHRDQSVVFQDDEASGPAGRYVNTAQSDDWAKKLRQNELRQNGKSSWVTSTKLAPPQRQPAPPKRTRPRSSRQPAQPLPKRTQPPEISVLPHVSLPHVPDPQPNSPASSKASPTSNSTNLGLSDDDNGDEEQDVVEPASSPSKSSVGTPKEGPVSSPSSHSLPRLNSSDFGLPDEEGASLPWASSPDDGDGDEKHDEEQDVEAPSLGFPDDDDGEPPVGNIEEPAVPDPMQPAWRETNIWPTVEIPMQPGWRQTNSGGWRFVDVPESPAVSPVKTHWSHRGANTVY